MLILGNRDVLVKLRLIGLLRFLDKVLLTVLGGGSGVVGHCDVLGVLSTVELFLFSFQVSLIFQRQKERTDGQGIESQKKKGSRTMESPEGGIQTELKVSPERRAWWRWE